MERREFLKATGAGLSAAALAGALPARLFAAPQSPYKAKHVVLIAFAGGVRSAETIEKPENVPNLMRLAGTGVVYPNVKAENVGHYGAALSIFTGRTEVFGIREQGRSDSPTVFEYLRRDAELPANSVWLSTTDGNQQVNFAYGNHPKFGARYGANLISADGLFNAEFKEIVDAFGKPKPTGAAEAEALERLRATLDAGAAARGGPADAAVEQFILDEIAGKTTELTGPGAADAKAVRVAGNILRVFKPAFIGIALQQADVAHGSYNAYVEIIRRNDAEIGRLLDGVQADPELRESTAVFVLPEFGRDRDLNERNGLDHGDNSESLSRVALVAAGPDFRTNKTMRETVATIDVAPTVCKLFGAKADYAKGKPLAGLFA
jgi:hypothetical protein